VTAADETAAAPRPAAAPGPPAPALLEIRDLVVRFGPVRAVDGVTLAIPSGPFGLALVGESGSGKTTIGRAVLHLVPAVGARQSRRRRGPPARSRVVGGGHDGAPEPIRGTAASSSAV